MLNCTNYATLTAQNIMSVGRFIRFSSKSEGNTLLLCSFRIHTLYLWPCFKLPLLDLRRKGSQNFYHKTNNEVEKSTASLVYWLDYSGLITFEKWSPRKVSGRKITLSPNLRHKTKIMQKALSCLHNCYVRITPSWASRISQISHPVIKHIIPYAASQQRVKCVQPVKCIFLFLCCCSH